MNLNFHTNDAGEHTARDTNNLRYTIRTTDSGTVELIIDRVTWWNTSYIDSAIFHTAADAEAVADRYSDLEQAGWRGFGNQLDAAITGTDISAAA